MLRQFNRFLLLAIIIALALYITLTNPESATIHIGPNISISAYAGVLYIGVFFIGVLAASIVALFFGLKGWFRERKLRAAERSRQAFFDLFIKARNFMANYEWQAARSLWETVISKDPDNIIARVELSLCLESLGDLKEALRVLDETRASSHSSTEVLMRAMTLNRALGNKTAAQDNLSILVAEAPSKRALEVARDIAEEMGRTDDALNYQRELEKVGYSSDQTAAIRTRLMYAHLVKSSEHDAALKEALTLFVKKHPTYVPALERLADLQLNQGQIDECAELLVKAAKASPGDTAKWSRVIDLWLSTAPGEFQRRAERALAAARSSTQGIHGSARIDTEFVVAKTLLATNRPQEAQQLLNALDALAEREGTKVSRTQEQTRLHLTGLCLSRLGQAKETAPLWEKLVEPGLPATNTGKRPVLSDRGEPSPALSTP
jgi:tetratricopeptide (TPR) repeat protein